MNFAQHGTVRIISIIYLDILEVEGNFAVFAVERPRFTFSLVVSVLL